MTEGNEAGVLDIAEREAITFADLMVSGRYRIQWTFAGDVAGSLIRKGLIDQGGYLTEAGLRARAQTQSDEGMQ